MRVLLLGMGSRGDVEPMLALGTRLLQSGYAVSLAAAADFRGLVTSWGLDFEPFSFDVQAGATSELGRRWLGGSSANQQREAFLMRQVVRFIAEPLADDLVRLVDRADAFVASAMTFEAMEPLARRVGKPLVHAMFQPTWPTAHGPSSTFALRPGADSWLNSAWSWGAAFAAWDVLRSPGGVMRRRLGMPRATFREYVAAARRTPTLLAASRHVVPRAPEWGAAVRQTGFWFGEPDPGWGPSAELAGFIEEGPPPVYLGFGSMATGDPEGVVRTFVQTVERLGRRGVVSAGWARLHASDLPDSVLPIGDVPHRWLFPRMAAVIHHGGAGTAAAAFRAGVPQVIVPHIADQPYWGRRVHELGVGSAPIRRKDLDVARLVHAVGQTLGAGPGSAAYALGERIRAEDGVGEAVQQLATAPGWAPRK